MFKTLRARSDTYITDRIIEGERRTNANVGQAASLDLYKLYGQNEVSGSAVSEQTRLLVWFDLDPLRALVTSQQIDITDPSFNVSMHLFDVYGGQPTPTNFDVDVYPLSQSFDEGGGRDIVKYSDSDSTNWLTASYPDVPWITSGCGFGGDASDSVDYVTEISGTSVRSTQTFVSGEEDLCVDVTAAVSATLVGLIPDAGFRVSYSEAIENDTRSYFVKRFGGRNAYNEDKHPQLKVRFDDSILDDSQILELDSSGSIFMYSYRRGDPANLLSGTVEITGSNSLMLRLTTPISGGTHDFYFTGSQFARGVSHIDGIYYADAHIPASDQYVTAKLLETGSVDFTPIWTSLDETIAFVTGSNVTFYPPTRTQRRLEQSKYTITATGLRQSHKTDERLIVRVNIFDHTSPRIKFVKRPIELPGIVIRDVHYQVRDAITAERVIPFDTTYKSTRCSSDNAGMYFELDTSSLRDQRSYVIDVMIDAYGSQFVYRDVSPVFRINDLQL